MYEHAVYLIQPATNRATIAIIIRDLRLTIVWLCTVHIYYYHYEFISFSFFSSLFCYVWMVYVSTLLWVAFFFFFFCSYLWIHFIFYFFHFLHPFNVIRNWISIFNRAKHVSEMIQCTEKQRTDWEAENEHSKRIF